MRERHDAAIARCCSVDYVLPKRGDTAVYVCPTCAAIPGESAPQARLVSAYELIADDAALELPDFGGERMALQDCWRSRRDGALHEAVRALLRRMNVQVEEVEPNRARADSCGVTLLREPSPRYGRLAPHLAASPAFRPAPQDGQLRYAREELAQRYRTSRVACYCTGCMEGVELAGREAVHVLGLIDEASR